MPLQYPDEAVFTYTNERISINFVDALSIDFDTKVSIEGTLDNTSGIVTTTRSANLAEPLDITIVLESQCLINGRSVIDILSEEYRLSISDEYINRKGTLKIVMKSTGETRTFPEAFLAVDPEKYNRSITRGGVTASFNILFRCAREIVNI